MRQPKISPFHMYTSYEAAATAHAHADCCPRPTYCMMSVNLQRSDVVCMLEGSWLDLAQVLKDPVIEESMSCQMERIVSPVQGRRASLACARGKCEVLTVRCSRHSTFRSVDICTETHS